ncbi:hypothetical protein FHS57_004785 [Runella defluvii]|uniref:Uncharacterized protein n=1 Tax=Runella defluvii TaxID=370973 RepID=A0A7W6ESI5_9BACT|nr:hypothetical protein [Runella defluvii]MBB3840765.1 hypothetical protein [Runella defluvii]
MIIGFCHNGENERVKGKITQWFTQTPYTHCELFIEPHGLALSARTDGKGVSLKPAKEVLKRSSNWDFLLVPTADRKKFNEWVMAEIGKPYDYGDIVKMVVPLPINIRESWFCSELCYIAAQKNGIYHLPNYPKELIHPGALYKLLTRAGAQPVDAYSTLYQ